METDLVLAGAVGVAGFATATVLQCRSRRYVTRTYWFAVAMVAVFGTMAADVLHGGLDVPYAGSTVLYAGAVAVVFLRWHRREGTLSIHRILTRRRETYSWVTILATFALGTAAGDFTAARLNLGYLTSAVISATIMVVPVVGWWKFNLNPVVVFWFAYVVTRPLGASVADWLGTPVSRSGLRWGDGLCHPRPDLPDRRTVAWLPVSRRDI